MPQPQIADVPPSAAPTIFIVDDEESVRNSLDSMLRSVGYQVETFANGPAFLARAAASMLGCAILDVRLPGASGLEIQRRLNEMGVSLPIIFITGHGDIEMAVSAMKAGAVEFLAKPYREQALLEALDVAIHRHRRESSERDFVQHFEQCLNTLSPRELEALDLIAKGFEAKEIAHRLDISEVTVRIHRRSILRKFGTRSTPLLVAHHARYTDRRLRMP